MTSDRSKGSAAERTPLATAPIATAPIASRAPSRSGDALAPVAARQVALVAGSADAAAISAPRVAASSPAVAASRFEFTPHNCFACGSLNASGLGLVLHVEPGRSWTELTLQKSFEGWEGIAHGGIICTILDEVMAWALVGSDNWGVTARMSVDFRRPVPVGRSIRAEGMVVATRRRIVETTARLIDATSGEVLATATGTYVAAREDRKRELRERYGFRLIPTNLPDSVDSPA